MELVPFDLAVPGVNAPRGERMTLRLLFAGLLQ